MALAIAANVSSRCWHDDDDDACCSIEKFKKDLCSSQHDLHNVKGVERSGGWILRACSLLLPSVNMEFENLHYKRARLPSSRIWDDKAAGAKFR